MNLKAKKLKHGTHFGINITTTFVLFSYEKFFFCLQANSYHIHIVPIQPQLEFPCTGDAIGAHFAPFDFDPSTSPKPAVGTPDQVSNIFYL
jgi:hypothetical protein